MTEAPIRFPLGACPRNGPVRPGRRTSKAQLSKKKHPTRLQQRKTGERVTKNQANPSLAARSGKHWRIADRQSRPSQDLPSLEPRQLGALSLKFACPLAVRVVREYTHRCAVSPAQGIGLPKSCGAARASRPVRARFFMVGRVVSTFGCAVPQDGKTNHGASGHQRVSVKATPFAGIGPRGRTITCGDRL